MSKKSYSLDTINHVCLPDQANNGLPPLPPTTELESQQVLRACIEARAALAELKSAAGLIPSEAMLINTLPVLESRASTEIENIVTTADRLFEHLNRESAADAATKEALRYREALMVGFRTLDELPVSTRMAEMVCTRMRGVEMRVRRVPGTKLINPTTSETIYTPPEEESRLRTMLSNWERFLNEPSQLDPLIRMAVAHYQFEAIHPFTDGNGRTGRILNSLYLIQENLLTLPILYLSRYIILHKNDYYRRLAAVTYEENWEDWILFMLNAVADCSRWTLSKIDSIRSLAEETRARVKAELPKIYSRELVDVLFQQPYCRIADVVDAGIAKRQTASTYLNELTSIGTLEKREVGRERLFVNTKLMAILTSDQRGR